MDYILLMQLVHMFYVFVLTHSHFLVCAFSSYHTWEQRPFDCHYKFLNLIWLSVQTVWIVHLKSCITVANGFSDWLTRLRTSPDCSPVLSSPLLNISSNASLASQMQSVANWLPHSPGSEFSSPKIFNFSWWCHYTSCLSVMSCLFNVKHLLLPCLFI